MKNIITLTPKEKEIFFQKINKLPSLGIGSEGSCHLYKDNSNKLKSMKIFDGTEEYEYNIDEIIMAEEYSLDSYAFPEVIYTCENKLVAYQTKLIERDFLDNRLPQNNYINCKKRLKEAIPKYLEDMEIISKDGIFTFDLIFNLMFDGKNLIGIDTPSYKHHSNNTYIKNIKALKDALLIAIAYLKQNEENNKFDPNEEISILSEEIDKLTKEKIKTYQKKKIK